MHVQAWECRLHDQNVGLGAECEVREYGGCMLKRMEAACLISGYGGGKLSA